MNPQPGHDISVFSYAITCFPAFSLCPCLPFPEQCGHRNWKQCFTENQPFLQQHFCSCATWGIHTGAVVILPRPGWVYLVSVAGCRHTNNHTLVETTLNPNCTTYHWESVNSNFSLRQTDIVGLSWIQATVSSIMLSLSIDRFCVNFVFKKTSWGFFGSKIECYPVSIYLRGRNSFLEQNPAWSWGSSRMLGLGGMCGGQDCCVCAHQGCVPPAGDPAAPAQGICSTKQLQEKQREQPPNKECLSGWGSWARIPPCITLEMFHSRMGFESFTYSLHSHK